MASWLLASILIVVVFNMTSVENYIKYGVTDHLNRMGDVLFKHPSRRVGRRVANWKPEHGVRPEELGSYAEGDIIMPKKNGVKMRNGLKAISYRWKNGIVPYKISEVFNKHERNKIMEAIRDYSLHTCVTWKPWSGEADYVHFVSKNTGCHSIAGRVGGKQEINLQSPICTTLKGTIVHEMMHAIGFLHEQARYDRDNFVDIFWNNIQPNLALNFKKMDPQYIDAFGVPYDYNSIMHYSENAFALDPRFPTILPKRKGVVLRYGEELSPGDIAKIRKMYNCK